MNRAAVRRLTAGVVAFAVAGLVPATAAGAGSGALSGGGATGRGLFLTYADQDTVIEGGTVAAPDFAAPAAQAAIDFTGLGSALAALGYSPYSDAAGVLNAFGGTELPVGAVGERSRAKVTGRPPQDQAVVVTPSAGQARARLVDGPTADAWASLASAPGMDVTAQIGEVRSTVTTVGATADSKVTVVLRWVRIGDLRIDTVTLTAAALADGGAGRATATTVVEGATLGGTAVRLTPRGFEPVGAAAPDASALQRTGLELVSAGGTSVQPGGGQSEARAIGPRLRFRSADGRLLTIVLGEASASSSRSPSRG